MPLIGYRLSRSSARSIAALYHSLKSSSFRMDRARDASLDLIGLRCPHGGRDLERRERITGRGRALELVPAHEALAVLRVEDRATARALLRARGCGGWRWRGLPGRGRALRRRGRGLLGSGLGRLLLLPLLA